MSWAHPVPLRAGRWLAFLGIVLVALNLRAAVTAMSPIARQIGSDIPLGGAGFGLIGMVPPIAFALAGVCAATVVKHFGLERLLILAIAAMVVGDVVRGLANSYALLLVGTVIVLVGMGFGNVLLPPLVKRYFPDHIGAVTAVYATALSVGAAIAAVVAVPVATAAGWRLSLGMWAVVAFVSLLPWLALLLQHRRNPAPESQRAPPEVIVRLPSKMGRIWRSRTAWMLSIIFAVSSFNAYAMFAWLPELLIETAGQTPAGAGVLLGLYSAVGIPFALVIPMLVGKIRNVGLLIQVGVLAFLLGYLGLALAPVAAPWLWAILLRSGSLMFPVCLALIGLRARTERGSVALSGFVQGIGYTLGALGPLLVGALHDLLGAWSSAYVLLIATVVIAGIAALLLPRAGFVEDEIPKSGA